MSDEEIIASYQNGNPNAFKDLIDKYTSSIYNFTVRLTDEDGHSIRVVVLGASSNETRFTEARDLANWVFSHYLWPDEVGYEQLSE